MDQLVHPRGMQLLIHALTSNTFFQTVVEDRPSVNNYGLNYFFVLQS